MIPDSRLFDILPQPPRESKDLLAWAGRLINVLRNYKPSIYNVFTGEYSSAVEYNPSFSNILKLTTSGGNCTLTTKSGRVGPVWIIITNDASAPRTITFSTGFQAAGNLVGVVNKTAVLEFISDGSVLWEVSRKENL